MDAEAHERIEKSEMRDSHLATGAVSQGMLNLGQPDLVTVPTNWML
jgi:hypothetical protein